MKLPLLVLGTFVSSFVFSQQVSEKQMAKHEEEVQKSKDKGTVIWDLDTVYTSGVPYCIIIEKSVGLFNHDYSVRSMAGAELIYVKYNVYNVPPGPPNPYGPANSAVAYYSYYFTDTRTTAEVPIARVFKKVYEDQLIAGNQVNSDAEAKFIALNGTKYSQALAAQSMPPPQASPAPPPPSPNYVVQRNRMAGIFINNGSINQDNVVIGTVSLNQVAENGDITKTITIFLPNGVQVAQATCIGINNHTWRVVTMKDNRFANVVSNFNNDNMDITKYLIGAYYL